MSFINRHPSSLKNKNNYAINKAVPPLIISKTLVNQTSVNSPSDFSDNKNG